LHESEQGHNIVTAGCAIGADIAMIALLINRWLPATLDDIDSVSQSYFGMIAMLTGILKETWIFTVEIAPYLLIGFALAGLLRAFVTERALARHLGGRGFGPVLKASLLGVPLPLCSCGVLPTAAGLRKGGASRAATSSFLISTPETGVDSIAVSWAMLDPVLTIARPVAALVTAIFTGTAQLGLLPEPTVSASSLREEPEENDKNIGRRMADGMRYSFLVLLADIAWYITLGMVLAGVVSYFLPPNLFGSLPGGRLTQIVIVAGTSVPLYICATSSTPLAAVLIAKGMSPGVALLFLLVGPATNISSLTVIYRLLGLRSTVIYLSGIVISGLVFCFATDWLYGFLSFDPAVSIADSVELVPGWLELPSAIVLIILLGYGIYKEKLRPLLKRLTA
jgi:uncharacterized protein